MVARDPIRIALAEDDLLVREGAASLLATVDDMIVVGTADGPDALRALVDEHEPDVVLLDIRMPPTHTTEGIDVALELRGRYPHLGVVILSQYADPEYALELLEGGSESVAYLLKERLGDSGQLTDTIRTVAGGGSVLDPRIVEGLLDEQRRSRDPRLAELTPRETEVLAAMASGRSNASIAEMLSITERSVEKHSSSIFAKLGLSETTELNRRVAAVVYFLQRRGR